LHAGRFELDPIAPGAERVVKFTFEVLPDFRREEAKLELTVYDLELREAVTENVHVPLTAPAQTVAAATGRVGLGANAVIRAWPDASAPAIASAAEPTTLTRTGTAGAFTRVDVGEGQPGWVATSDVSAASGRGALTYPLSHRAPTIEVNTGNNSHVTQATSIQLRGVARDDQRVRDVYIFVGARKVLYRASPGTNAHELSFDATIPLHGGINYITVFARENDEIISRHVLQVRRDAPDGSLMETPRFDEELYDMVHD
jgi:carboxyl-terminal processing protease